MGGTVSLCSSLRRKRRSGIRRSLQINPNQADALRNRAAIRIQKELYKDAYEDLLSAIKINKNFKPAYELARVALRNMGEEEKLVGLYKRIEQEEWTPRMASSYIAALELKYDAYTAWNYAKNGLIRWASDEEFLIAAGVSAQKAGKSNESEKIYEKLAASEKSRFRAHALNNMAVIYLQRGLTAQAVNAIKEASRNDNCDSNVMLQLVEALTSNGEIKKAREIYRT